MLEFDDVEFGIPYIDRNSLNKIYVFYKKINKENKYFYDRYLYYSFLTCDVFEIDSSMSKKSYDNCYLQHRLKEVTDEKFLRMSIVASFSCKS